MTTVENVKFILQRHKSEACTENFIEFYKLNNEKFL